MDRKQISSSRIRSVGYDTATRTLQVEFNNGDIFDYYPVPEDIYRRMMSASSVASFFADRIEEDYSSRRVR